MASLLNSITKGIEPLWVREYLRGSNHEYIVFYAGKLYSRHPYNSLFGRDKPADLPDGAYIYDSLWCSSSRGLNHWYYSDWSPCPDEDVPKPLLIWVAALT